mmetsp:Transcript_84071/g.116135  ORF Transcript_84071/g.116135 Transcript_84071/m.116135 type:complete len:232 (-) Transcript_84071:331-1026(-)
MIAVFVSRKSFIDYDIQSLSYSIWQTNVLYQCWKSSSYVTNERFVSPNLNQQKFVALQQSCDGDHDDVLMLTLSELNDHLPLHHHLATLLPLLNYQDRFDHLLHTVIHDYCKYALHLHLGNVIRPHHHPLNHRVLLQNLHFDVGDANNDHDVTVLGPLTHQSTLPLARVPHLHLLHVYGAVINDHLPLLGIQKHLNHDDYGYLLETSKSHLPPLLHYDKLVTPCSTSLLHH